MGISHPFAAQADLGVYAASKVALKALADATRAELRAAKRPYCVSCLSPVLVETDFYLAKAEPHAAGIVYAAAETLAASDAASSPSMAAASAPLRQDLSARQRCRGGSMGAAAVCVASPWSGIAPHRTCLDPRACQR